MHQRTEDRLTRDTCTVKGCQSLIHVKKYGLCNAHYLRQRRHGTPTGGATPHFVGDPDAAFEARTLYDPETGCMNWIGATQKGYGAMRTGGQTVRAHRFAWVRANGSIPDGMHVLHKCDNPLCCNADHLFLGTHIDNMRDAVAKGRAAGGSLPGEANPNCMLKEAQVVSILSRKGKPSSSLAREFGVSNSTVKAIRAGRLWSYVSEGGAR